jgi:hypothetical protein
MIVAIQVPKCQQRGKGKKDLGHSLHPHARVEEEEVV